MNPDRDFDRMLDQWFADGPMEVADRVVGQVADRIERQPQRPAWRLLWRSPMRPAIIYGLAAAAVLIVAVVGYNLLPRGPSVGGPRATVTPAPTETSSAPTPSPVPGLIDASRFGVPLTLTLSGDWTYLLVEPNNLELLHGGTDLGFHPLSKVTLPGTTTTDPWIPVPADFIAWVQERPEFTDFQAPRPVTVGGRAGTEIDAAFVWETGMTKRDFLRYTSGAWLYDEGNVGHRIRFIIVPGTAGDGFMIVVNIVGADFDAATTELDAVLATVQYLPPTASPAS